jgi:hypothetical protein
MTPISRSDPRLSRSDPRLTLTHDASKPPRPVLEVNPDLPPDVREIVAAGTYIARTLGYSLLRSAYHLAEMSSELGESYHEGKSVSDRCIAAATGAIAVACAGVEALMNEILLFARDLILSPAKSVLLSRATNLAPRDKVTAIAALADQAADWGVEPYQSYDLLLTTRRVLIHHEPEWVNATAGYWPVAKLKDLVNRIHSPYTPIQGLDWCDHMLSPNGASWAVDTAFGIANLLEECHDAINPDGPSIL